MADPTPKKRSPFERFKAGENLGSSKMASERLQRRAQNEMEQAPEGTLERFKATHGGMTPLEYARSQNPAASRDIQRDIAEFVAIPPGNIRRSDGRPDFDYLRRLYAVMTPHLLMDRWVDPYFVDWPSIFTPIESQMWTLIRSQPVPFYPQYPVGGYFIDFANPRLKVGIECDSRGWHERRADLDEMRARDLYQLGWLVFGFSGRACMRLPELPPLARMAERWRAAGHGEPLPTTKFDRVPVGWQDRYDGESEVDLASKSTFEWFGPCLVEYVWEEERREQGFDE
jgi:hypothetical protein